MGEGLPWRARRGNRPDEDRNVNSAELELGKLELSMGINEF
jgi:hypothetical protein